MAHRLLLPLSALWFAGCVSTPKESPLPDSPDNIVLSVPGMQ